MPRIPGIYVFLSYYTIIVGGILIFIGWPPKEPICIVCAHMLPLELGVINVLLGAVGVVRSFNRAGALAVR